MVHDLLHDVASVAMAITAPYIAIIPNSHHLFHPFQLLVSHPALGVSPLVGFEPFFDQQHFLPEPAYKGGVAPITPLVVEVAVNYLLHT